MTEVLGNEGDCLIEGFYTPEAHGKEEEMSNRRALYARSSGKRSGNV